MARIVYRNRLLLSVVLLFLALSQLQYLYYLFCFMFGLYICSIKNSACYSSSDPSIQVIVQSLAASQRPSETWIKLNLALCIAATH